MNIWVANGPANFSPPVIQQPQHTPRSDNPRKQKKMYGTLVLYEVNVVIQFEMNHFQHMSLMIMVTTTQWQC